MGKLNTVKNGKGSKPRPTDKPKYDGNFDLIDWNKATKSKYHCDKTTSKPARSGD